MRVRVRVRVRVRARARARVRVRFLSREGRCGIVLRNLRVRVRVRFIGLGLGEMRHCPPQPPDAEFPVASQAQSVKIKNQDRHRDRG